VAAVSMVQARGAAQAGTPVDEVSVRRLLSALEDMRDGKFRRRLPERGDGVLLDLARTFNQVAERNARLAAELRRVRRTAGRDGRLAERLDGADAPGTWAEAYEDANALVDDLVRPVTEVARVIEAVAEGDLSQRIELRSGNLPLRGEFLRIGRTVNAMVDQLALFTAEVTRVAREVGTEGNLGGQAKVRGVSGSWKDLTVSVNSMASNLTSQVRDIAQVTTAVANGDLSRKITVDVKGELFELKSTINTMVDQLSSFASEVTRVAREVGSEGKLGGQAEVPGVSGTWKDLTDNVNGMASNLTGQVRSIAQVSTAVARGDLSQKITVEAKGEVATLADTINTMVDTLRAFADEVTRVAREVGTEGRLGGQADVQGVAGTWKDLTDNVNGMASNLTGQVRNIAQVTTAVARGDLTQKITVDARGEILELKTTINTMVDQLSAFADEVTRVAREVGTDGILGGQAQVRGVGGTWKDLTDNVNSMALNLTGQVRSIAQVSTAVARGDLSQKISVEAKGEVAALAQTINTMVDTLRAFADEVTRVAREVGTEGILGGQAQVPNVAGTWKDLTDNVNSMAFNLTSQVRSIANVTTAVAKGDLTQKIYVDARGEILELKNTINTMVDQLSSFAAEVTRVAREVGSEGKLGGQAEVEGVSGTWKKLTENVNQLASTLTNQLRAIAEVSTAVTRGDLTRQVAVDASGEVAELKDNINQMIANLRETTLANEEQDWLKTNLARITGLVQGRRDLSDVTDVIMRELTPSVSAQHGAFFLAEGDQAEAGLRLVGTYGYSARADLPTHFQLGEALVGQAAKERRRILIPQAPTDYIRVTSGLGGSAPASIAVLPVPFEGRVLGVIELASLTPFTEVHLSFLDQLMELIGVSLNAILASSRTEELLAESQRLATELQEKQAELQSQQEALEERAEQLSQSSRYKSEFLANMSHELRTPLNSLLILARLLTDNTDGNLTDKQVEFARTIHSSGTDLLQLINDILDLSKVEAGKMDVHVGQVSLTHIVEYVEATFRPLTTDRALGFELSVSPGLPQSVHTDEHRLQQILRNLVSNAVKFTAQGTVRLVVEPATKAQVSRSHLGADVIAFSVVDTGIGIPAEKLRVIFEAFQQADGTTSRRYGGTGLGLSISREIAHLLGGEIQAASRVGEGSTFTLLLPVDAFPAGPAGIPSQGGTPVPELTPRPSREVALLDDEAFAAKKVLIVDDDVRNVFALTSVLERRGMSVVYAENGREGIAALEQNADVDLVLMDVMMPEMDGYATTEAIRATPRFATLPIIALTAKAMQGDRDKSLASGASDYVTKPVDIDLLLATMRLWLSQQP
jgi:signal transduction histidine kinase/HAMP domain-containing protein/CheY-like chemotaxis protein